MFKALVIALSLLSPVDRNYEPAAMPALNLSAVRYIYCTSKEGDYSGSGFLIAPGIVATARHVAHGGKCMDVATETPLKSYYEDDKHDFALMSDPRLPVMPYIKYRCDGIQAGKVYMSYGITDWGQKMPLLRMDHLVATNKFVTEDNDVTDFPHSLGMRILEGPIAPGMSGGPVTDSYGYVVAVNNAGNSRRTLLFDLRDTVLCKT